MKKLISVFLAILMLCTCCVSAFALTDEEAAIDERVDKSQPAYMQMLEAASYLDYISVGQSNPVQTRVYQKDGLYYVDVTYTPAYYMAYFRNNSYYTINPDTDYILLSVNLRIDDADWIQNQGIYGMFMQCTNLTQKMSFSQTEPYTFTMLMPTPVNEELERGPYGEFFEIKDGVYHLDLSKHTIEMQLFVDAYFGEEQYKFHLPQSPITTIQAVTEENIPQTLPAPDVQRVYASKKDDVLSFRVTPQGVMDGLRDLSHEVYVRAEYTVHGNTKTVDLPYTTEFFYTISLEDVKWIDDHKQTETNNNDIKFRCAFYDKTTNTLSAWAESEVNLQDERDPETIDGWTPGSSSTDTKDKVCNLCGKCPAQPLDMCLWMFIGAIVCIVIAGTTTILIVIDNKKAKTSHQSENNKPKKEKK